MDNIIDHEVTVTISTCGRTHSTLPLTLSAILNQTLLPAEILIYDDNDQLSVIASPWWPALQAIAESQEVILKVKEGKRRGQVANHQQALNDVTTSWIWRNDDDAIPGPDVLHQLRKVSQQEDKCVALAPLILLPKSRPTSPLPFSSSLADIFVSQSIQHRKEHDRDLLEVEHLQGSSFLFRTEVARAQRGYHPELSQVGHREETMFTHTLTQNGGKLFVVTSAVVRHLHYSQGGIREANHHQLFEQDEAIFSQYLEDQGITPTDPFAQL